METWWQPRTRVLCGGTKAAEAARLEGTGQWELKVADSRAGRASCIIGLGNRTDFQKMSVINNILVVYLQGLFGFEVCLLEIMCPFLWTVGPEFIVSCGVAIVCLLI